MSLGQAGASPPPPLMRSPTLSSLMSEGLSGEARGTALAVVILLTASPSKMGLEAAPNLAELGWPPWGVKADTTASRAYRMCKALRICCKACCLEALDSKDNIILARDGL